MSEGEHILEYARSLFDEVGVAVEPGTGDTMMVLGLVSTPERDLDDFAHAAGRTVLQGFIRHAKAREDDLLKFIRERGFEAELVGELGYPLRGKPNLKHLAVAAGIGEQGKNTLVISPRFGPWLRFMAIRTNAPLAATGPGAYMREGNPRCEGCDECVRACPESILAPYRLLDADRCLAAISEDRPAGLAICDRCVVTCPVGERRAAL